jgi:hypothetical protein
MRNHIRCATAIAIAGFCSVLPGCYSKATDFQQLARMPASTEGRVVYVDCASHGLLVYEFNLGGRAYRAKTTAISCGSAKLGDQVMVFYDANHPDTNTLLQPAACSLQPAVAYERARGWYIPEWMWNLLFPCLGMAACLLYYLLVHERRKQSQPKTK